MTRQWTDAHGLLLNRHLLGFHECGEINGTQWLLDGDKTFRLPDFPNDPESTMLAADAWVSVARGSRRIEFGAELEYVHRYVWLFDRLRAGFPMRAEGATWIKALAWALWRAETR
jgi:hypothetical protein